MWAVTEHVSRHGGSPVRVVVLSGLMGPVLISAGVMGHLDDAVATVLLAASLVAVPSFATGLAIAVKPWAVVGLRIPRRQILLSLATATILYLPFLPSLDSVSSAMALPQRASTWSLVDASPPDWLRLVELPLLAGVALAVSARRGPLSGLMAAAVARCLIEPGDFLYYSLPLAVFGAGMDGLHFRCATIFVWLGVVGTITGSAGLRTLALIGLLFVAVAVPGIRRPSIPMEADKGTGAQNRSI